MCALFDHHLLPASLVAYGQDRVRLFVDCSFCLRYLLFIHPYSVNVGLGLGLVLVVLRLIASRVQFVLDIHAHGSDW